MSRGLNLIFIWVAVRWNSRGKLDLCEYLLLFVLSVVIRIWYVLSFSSTASNPFHKDHQRGEAQGARNTSTLEAVGPSAPGSQSLSFLQGDHEDTWTGLDNKGQKEKLLCQRMKRPKLLLLHKLNDKEKKHIITPQISMLLLHPVFPGSILSMTKC